MYRVIKRNNQKVEFDFKKIVSVIQKAFDALNKPYDNDVIELLGIKVTSDFEKKINNNEIHVEDIQDSVEKILFETGYGDVAKIYILYRKKHEKQRLIESISKDYETMMDRYVKSEIDNRNKTIGDMVLANSAAITKNYWLHSIFDEDLKKAYYDGFVYYQDLEYLSPSSLCISIKKLIDIGLEGFEINFRKAKHFDSIINHLRHFICAISNEWSDKIIIKDFDTYLASYAKKDDLGFEGIKQVLESFVYSINVNNRFGTYRIPCILSLNFEDENHVLNDYVKMIDLALFEIIDEGDASGIDFMYPTLNIALYSNFKQMEFEERKKIYKAIAKGRHIMIRNVFDDKEQAMAGATLLNLPLIANTTKNEKEFLDLLNRNIDISLRALKYKRDVNRKLFNENLYPFTSIYIDNDISFDTTLFLYGLNELINEADFLNEGYDLDVVKYIKKYIDDKRLNFNVVLDFANKTNIMAIIYKNNVAKGIKNYEESISFEQQFLIKNDNVYSLVDYIKKASANLGHNILLNLDLSYKKMNFKSLEALIDDLIDNKKINIDFTKKA